MGCLTDLPPVLPGRPASVPGQLETPEPHYPALQRHHAALAFGTTHDALWSAEHPTTASLEAARGTPRVNDFYPDDRLPVADQAQVEDYRRSGYDRDHMTPSGDMPGTAAQDQSFSLANMVPQTPQLNRDIWEGIQSAVRHLTEGVGEPFLIIDPAFIGQELKSIGSDGVLVSLSTWKAVYDPRTCGVGVYVCKNTAVPTCVDVSVAAFGEAAGVDLFPALSLATKAITMALPEPDASPYAAKGNHGLRHRSRNPPGTLVEWGVGSGTAHRLKSPCMSRIGSAWTLTVLSLLVAADARRRGSNT